MDNQLNLELNINQIIRDEKGYPSGHICNCGENYRWPGYVFAHWREGVNFTCPKCNQIFSILREKLIKD
jgi:hypothetical protein